MVQVRAEIAALQAREARLLAAGVDLATQRAAERRDSGRRTHADLPLREVSAELGAAMRVSDRAVQGRMSDASTLVSRFSATLVAWEEGRVDAAHVSAILDSGAAIVDDETRARFERRVLQIAGTECATRVRAIARSVAAQLDPDGERDRMADAENRRMVRLVDRGDGMSRLIVDMQMTLAHGILDRLTQMANAVQGRDRTMDAAVASDPSIARDACSASATSDGDHARDEANVTENIDVRTTDQLRVDILCDLLLTGGPVGHGDGLTAIRGRVHVTVSALSLAGLDDAPALLAAAGPIDLDTARRLAGGAPGWERVLTHPFTGAVLAVDRYRPDAALVRFLAARDEHCRFPGCRRPAHRCDVDHTVDAALGGATAERNLAHFCRRHHTLKHNSAWTVQQRGDGVLEWTSPALRRYIDRPPPTVRFVPRGPTVVADGDPPPF